jgi:hypothetical protein
MLPPLPEGQSPIFRVSVHGTVFADRAARVSEVSAGDTLLLIPDPPMEDEPLVWVHLLGGDPVGHLPPEVSGWLAPWLYRGGIATATATKVRGTDVPSWKRLIIDVTCRTE